MAPEKNRVRKSIFEPASVLSILEADVSFACTEVSEILQPGYSV